MDFKAKFLVSTILLFLILGYQNCSPKNSPVSFTDESSKLNNETDSGTPYEGKIYATLGLCEDGTEVQSRIVLASPTQAQLNRENCRDIAPQQLASTDFQMDPNADALIYKNQNFKYIGMGPLKITNFTVSNDANNFYYGYTYDGQPSWLQIFLDTDNDPTTGFYHNGIGAEYMIENDNVWSYSAAAGAPQETWAWNPLVSANKNNVSPNISWSFARTAIGSPTVIKLVAHTSLGSKSEVVTQIPK